MKLDPPGKKMGEEYQYDSYDDPWPVKDFR